MNRKPRTCPLSYIALPELSIPDSENGEHPAALYEQLAAELRHLIFSQKLKNGDSLPSLRNLSRKLSVSIDTVRRAYFLLIDEGLAESKAGSGYKIVSDSLIANPTDSATEPAFQRITPSSGDLIDLCRKKLQYFRAGHYQTRPFLYFGETIELAKDNKWNSIVASLNKMTWRHTSYSDPQGTIQLREAIAQTLLRHRGIPADAENVVITTGTIQSLNLLSTVLLNPGDSAALGAPAPNLVPDIFKFHKIHPKFIPVLNDGLDLQKLFSDCSDCKAVLTVPSNQIPLSICTSLTKRRSLLSWAQRNGKWIFENGMEDLFWLRNRLPPITALDHLGGNSIFMDSFTLLFFPGIRIGYIAAPADLARTLAGAKLLIDRTTSAKVQDYLGMYLKDEAFSSYLRKLNKIFTARSTYLKDILRQELSEFGTVSDSRCGCHLTFTISRPELQDKLIKEKLGQKGLTCRAVSEFPGGDTFNGLVLGFGLFTEPELKKAVLELKEIMQSLAH